MIHVENGKILALEDTCMWQKKPHLLEMIKGGGL
jgi:hypothetical protein